MQEKKLEFIRPIGKGGMGEVFLTYDPFCKRQIALKRIRKDLWKYEALRQRFLQEARIAAKLSHPSIMPVFSIQENPPDLYYTMPYIEGSSLSTLLKELKTQPDQGSMQRLMHIFLKICEGVAYAHAKGILHRDLKPDNILLGTFGEVLILDWGLAEEVDAVSLQEEPLLLEEKGLTSPGKIVGTLSHLAPERILGQKASYQTEVYALGVILYQMLTLCLPFHRKDLSLAKQALPYEQLSDPMEVAPERDIPSLLKMVVMKALSPSLEERYLSVHALILDLQAYLEGKPQWNFVKNLQLTHAADWEFQENVSLTHHFAISQKLDTMSWATLMVAKEPILGKVRMDILFKLQKNSQGLGFLLDIPYPQERKQIIEGFLFWIHLAEVPILEFSYQYILINQVPLPSLKAGRYYLFSIEKRENQIRALLDGELIYEYSSLSPLKGPHVGIMYKDTSFAIDQLHLFSGAQNTLVSCLSIPDAFLAKRDFHAARTEYKKIALSFPGYAEGREALLRSGLALLEQAKQTKSAAKKKHFFHEALQEFTLLSATSNAPLEYLGKALVYQSMGDIKEEIKCLELAVRKYPANLALQRVIDYIHFRFHESCNNNRKEAYFFALLCLRLAPLISLKESIRELLAKFESYVPTPPFLSTSSLLLSLAFWTNHKATLIEIVEGIALQKEALLSLFFMGHTKIALALWKKNPFPSLKPLILFHTHSLSHALKEKKLETTVASYLYRKVKERKEKEALLPFLSIEEKIAFFLEKNSSKEGEKLLRKCSKKEKINPHSPLFFLQGCYIWKKEGEKAARKHFEKIPPLPYPPLACLGAAYLIQELKPGTGRWLSLFSWEKISLYQQLALLAQVTKKRSKYKEFTKQIAHIQKENLK